MAKTNRKKEFIKQINELGRNVNCDDYITFTDDVDMYRWYNNSKSKYNKLLQKEELSETDEKFLKEFKQILKAIKDLNDLREKEKINEIHEKKEEYIKAITQLGRNISKSDHYNKNYKYLSGFYTNLASQVEKAFKEGKVNELSIERARVIAEIDNTLFDLKKIEYKNRVEEYMEVVKFIKKNVDTNYFMFKDEKRMKHWYEAESKQLVEERKNNIIPTPSRMEEIMEFAKIDDYLNDNQKEDFDIKYEEYMAKIDELDRPLDSDYLLFSDGKNMNVWYKTISSEIISKRKTNRTSKEDMHKIRCMAEIDNKLKKYTLKRGK